MSAKSYKCAACKGIFDFEEGCSEEDRLAEYTKNFSSVPGYGPKEIVCDGCYQKLLKWEAEIIKGQGTGRPVGLLVGLPRYHQRTGTED